MIQLTHLGRRTSWSKGDWLPSISSGKHREPAHKAFPKIAESWDIERIIKEYGDAAERMKEGGMDGVELEGQGHLIGQFLSPLSNDLETEYGTFNAGIGEITVKNTDSIFNIYHESVFQSKYNNENNLLALLNEHLDKPINLENNDKLTNEIRDLIENMNQVPGK